MSLNKPKPHERAYHPLFPVADDAEPALLAKRDITWLYVWRDKELHEDSPFPHDAFADPSDLVRRWGGGVYEVRSKDAEKKGYTANVSYSFTGPKKPFNTPEPARSAVVGDASNHFAINLIAAVAPIVTAWMSQQSARDERLARESELREERRRQEMKLEQAQFEARLKAQQDAQLEQTKLLMASMQQNQHGNQIVTALEKGMALGQNLRTDADDDIAESLGAFMSGFGGANKPSGQPS